MFPSSYVCQNFALWPGLAGLGAPGNLGSKHLPPPAETIHEQVLVPARDLDHGRPPLSYHLGFGVLSTTS